MTDQRDSTEPPPPFERLDWFRDRCTGACAKLTLHKRKAGTTGGECGTCGAKLPNAGTSNGHAVELAGASVAHASAAAVAVAQSLSERAEPELLCVYCTKPLSAHTNPRSAGFDQPSSDYCVPYTGRRFTPVVRAVGPMATAELRVVAPYDETARAVAQAEPMAPTVSLDGRTTIELQRDLAIATAECARLQAEVDRWAERVRLLESERDQAVLILQGRRR